MTKALKALLQHYGALVVTISRLSSERPGNDYESLDSYYAALGSPLPDEPVLAVRISKDEKTRFLDDLDHELAFEAKTGQRAGKVSVLELPEDEYWFFHAFRPGMFDLEKELPPFIYSMGLVDAFAMFEGYLTDVLRACFRTHPKLMGSGRKIDYEQIINATSQEAIIDQMIEREVRNLVYLPISGVLETMRKKFGFSSLVDVHDRSVCELAQVRNCLLHNQGKADQKLSNLSNKYPIGETLHLDMKTLNDAVNTLRKLAYEIDKAAPNQCPASK